MALHTYPRSPNILVPLFSQITEYSRSTVGISTVTHYSLAVLSASEFLIIPSKFSGSVSRKSTNILVFSEIHEHSCIFRNPRTFLNFQKSTNILVFSEIHKHSCVFRNLRIFSYFRNPRTFFCFQKSTNILVFQKSTNILSSLSETGGTLRQSVSG